MKVSEAMKTIITSMLRNARLTVVVLAALATSALLPQRAQATNPIWINPMTCGAPIGTYYRGDSLGSEWYVNFEIGQASWDYAQVGYGTNSAGTSFNWGVANWYQDGDGSNKRVRRNIGGLQFTSTGNWYLICQARESSGNTYTSAAGCGWVNTTAYPPSSMNNYFTVNALNAPTGQSATQNSGNPTTQIDLAWTKGVSGSAKDTLILRNTSDSFTDPTQGTTYNVNDIIGGATVIYRGGGTSLNDTGRSPGTRYYYKFYAENNSYYSAGVSANACTLPSITSQPANSTNCSGSTAQFVVAATAATPNYQWQVWKGSSWADAVENTDGAGSTSATFTTVATTTGMDGYKYRCAITNACGNVTNSSDNVSLTVNASPTAANDNFNRTPGLALKIAKTNLLANDSVGSGFFSADTTTNSVTLASDAKYLYYPSNAANVSDRFTYTVTNASGCSATAMVYISINTDVFGTGPGQVTKTSTNATAIMSGIPNYSYSVQRATNVSFTLGVSNFPSVSAPANGQITNIDDFADLFGTPNINAPDSAYYRLHYTP
jgi:hypothetical protein